MSLPNGLYGVPAARALASLDKIAIQDGEAGKQVFLVRPILPACKTCGGNGLNGMTEDLCFRCGGSGDNRERPTYDVPTGMGPDCDEFWEGV